MYVAFTVLKAIHARVGFGSGTGPRLKLIYHHTPPCRNFVYQLRRISGDAGMLTKEPFFLRYVTGVDSVEPIFRQLKQDRPDLQLIMVVLPGKTPIYGEGELVLLCVFCSPSEGA